MPKNWGEYVRNALGWTSAGSMVLSGVTAPAFGALPNATSLTTHPQTGPTPLTFERPNYNDGDARFAGHSSHASHASHSSHYSGSGGGYYSPSPAPAPLPEYTPPVQAAPPPPTVPRAAPARATAVDKLVMVMRVQAKLHDLGYYSGTIDGKLGPKTTEALRRYQAVQRYPVTGKMDDATLAGLGIVY